LIFRQNKYVFIVHEHGNDHLDFTESTKHCQHYHPVKTDSVLRN